MPDIINAQGQRDRESVPNENQHKQNMYNEFVNEVCLNFQILQNSQKIESLLKNIPTEGYFRNTVSISTKILCSVEILIKLIYTFFI